MKICAVLIEDRHCDPEICLFSTPKKAIAFAKERAKKADRYEQLDESLTTAMKQAGWIYNATMGDDMPTVHVEELEVDYELD